MTKQLSTSRPHTRDVPVTDRCILSLVLMVSTHYGSLKVVI